MLELIRGEATMVDVEGGLAKVQWSYVGGDEWFDGFPPRIGKPGRRVIIRYVWISSTALKTGYKNGYIGQNKIAS